jgi:glycosyltransferase involved in cell wall biosynthesis
MLPEYLAVGATRRALARLACLQYERIVCVNPKIAETIASLGIPAERIDIMAAFLPPSRRRVPLPESLEQWFKAHDPVVSTALFFRPEYGVEILIRAIARIREQFPRLGCLIMGSGPDQMAAEMHIEDQGLTGSFRLQGDVDHDLCLAAIGQSALFVRPTFEDGDSISVREALALGVPVVASAVGTRPEGVHLFERGNAEALAAEMIRALSSKSAGNGPAPADPSRRLFEILENVSQCPI